MKRWAIPSFIPVLLFVTAAGAQDCHPRPRLISTTGTAELKVPPDEAVLSFGIVSRDKLLAPARSENEATVKKVIALARGAGVDAKDIQTSSIYIAPDYSSDKVPKFLAYDVSQNLAITLRDLQKYETLLTELLEAGVTRVHSISFGVSEPRRYKDEAQKQAIRAAREKAVVLATELGQKVGAPWEINESGSGYLNIVTRATSNYAGYAGVANQDVQESALAPGQITIQASVQVSFRLE